jgi:hypothetical protein
MSNKLDYTKHDTAMDFEVKSNATTTRLIEKIREKQLETKNDWVNTAEKLAAYLKEKSVDACLKACENNKSSANIVFSEGDFDFGNHVCAMEFILDRTATEMTMDKYFSGIQIEYAKAWNPKKRDYSDVRFTFMW